MRRGAAVFDADGSVDPGRQLETATILPGSRLRHVQVACRLDSLHSRQQTGLVHRRLLHCLLSICDIDRGVAFLSPGFIGAASCGCLDTSKCQTSVGCKYRLQIMKQHSSSITKIPVVVRVDRGNGRLSFE